MSDTISELQGLGVLICAPDGAKLRKDRDAVDLIGEALHAGAATVAVPVECFDEDFFHLRTRILGEIVQKFVQYRRRLVIVGAISRYLAESSSFKAFVAEANRGNDIWFVGDLSELHARLAGTDSCSH